MQTLHSDWPSFLQLHKWEISVIRGCVILCNQRVALFAGLFISLCQSVSRCSVSFVYDDFSMASECCIGGIQEKKNLYE